MSFFAAENLGLHLWWVPLPTAAPATAEQLAILSSTEIDRWQLIRTEQARADFVASHVGLRRVLGAYVGVSPRRVEFAAEPCWLCQQLHGKPILSGHPEIHYSLSHTRGAAVIGVAKQPIGVDLERMDARSSILEILPMLHPDEQRQLRQISDVGDRSSAALACWVLKESVMKALGGGLAIDLNSFTVASSSTDRKGARTGRVRLKNRDVEWHGDNITMNDYAVAYAATGSAPAPLKPRMFTIPDLPD